MTRPAVADPAQHVTVADDHATPTASVVRPTAEAPVPMVAVPAYPAEPLVVGRADDPAERDADRVADRALERLRRTPADARPSLDGPDPRWAAALRRSGDHAHGSARIGVEGGAAPHDVSAEIAANRGSGSPLDPSVRARMESAFGASLSAVRVHTGPTAERLNRAVSARAFTVGQDIYFGAGEYRPASADGERVLAHEIAHTRQPATAARRAIIRRLAHYDDPRGWGNVRVRRSGEGVAGVYFVGPDRDLVVKPLASTGTVQYANTFMGAMGLDAPSSVRYTKNSPQGAAIAQLLLAAEDVRSKDEVQNQIDAATAFLVMEKMSGTSIQTMDDRQAAEFLQNAQALQDTGKIMVADAFLGNGDRLLGTVNLGNFFYEAATLIAPGQIRTIDNESKFGVSSTRRKRNGAKGVDQDLDARIHQIEMLIDPVNRMGPIVTFLTKFRQSHRDHNTAIGVLNAQIDTIKAEISQGITNALADMARVFTTNLDLVRSVGHGYDQESEPSRNSSTAKATAKYVKARQNGMDPDQAERKLAQYVEYRARRDRTPTGFKWVTKLVSKTGF